MTTFTILTSGCAHNFSDSEQMAGLLKEAKFDLIQDVETADIIIFNTCTVKSPSESAFFTNLEKIKTQHPYKTIVIAGCIPQADPLNPKLKDYCLLGTRQIHKIVEVVEEALNNNVVRLLETGEMPPLNLPRVRRNPVVGVIPISLGCLGACTFCKTKSARFTLQSYPIADIKREVEHALNDGVREIWLTSQDTFCYGFDLGTDLVALLKELVTVSGEYMIRIGMGNPDHLPKIKQGLLEIYQHPKIFKFLHLPLQAGHDETLKEMKRRYAVEDFVSAVQEFRAEIPEITIMTDIIVGYPTETDEEYQATIEVMRKTTPACINISRFWPRPGTKAAKLEPLPGEIVNHRSKTLTAIFQNISQMQNERWQGWEGKIIIDEKGTQENQWIGRNFAYKPVLVDGNFKLGDRLDVKIIKTTTFDLRGEVIRREVIR
ncbi:tRNA (N(6)-L-threonylcarbamoyladenosine(37)-C(2))-methylthiotransferase [Candidatus Woesearchaeota archaeon]|nr:tRNA (N(6)-L-threonylcarbamoyladenosine(37)-C(2))-methylthiotransferase [Candidatus Woesearchaeota archaeon]